MVRIETPARIEPDLLEELMNASFDARFGERWSPEQVIAALAMPGATAAFAFTGPENSRPAGFALTRQVADEAELLLIAVLPGQRGAGIGGRLLDHAIAQSAAAGARHMYLEVREGNTVAYALYSSRGFEVVGRRPGYYRADNGELHDALTMHLALNGI
ncbi:ribosomal protein S18-alanine N-acetyltransferase [Pedomonas mirosovicensis]|uniref:ribosomal protein S18-alanine N-acetyltransferase n=1 Tax=Pedomonas mirosovicensis TaxID=2908641 RepID=UPI00216AAC3B|nr:ribosomal protein S18-alanine N-acetyltransferase [Pedomonas mirosovicensis]MCH8683993.1 ribosomal protein S18-alanine N-acetyltransferase [Pedomonas mirosovicensis]